MDTDIDAVQVQCRDGNVLTRDVGYSENVCICMLCCLETKCRAVLFLSNRTGEQKRP